MLTRTRITTPETPDSIVLAMVLGEMQSRGLIKSKPNNGKKPGKGEPRAVRSAEEDLRLIQAAAGAD
jgi:hypothetical protein